MKPQNIKLQIENISFDVAPEALQESTFNDCENFTPNNGIYTRAQGWLEVYNGALTDNILFLLNVRTENDNYWIYCTESAVHVADSFGHRTITPDGYANVNNLDNQFTAAVIGGLPVINHPFLNPFTWDFQAAKCADLIGWPAGTKCRAIRAFKYHLIAMNVSDSNGDFGEYLMWSDAAAAGELPKTWTPASANEAGFNALSATKGQIVDGLTMRDEFFIYKNNSIYAMRYVGGQFVFNFRHVLDNIGLMARNCVVNAGSFQAFISETDVMLFDGQSAVSISDNACSEYLHRYIDTSATHKTLIAYDQEANHILICLPSAASGEVDQALVYELSSKKWGKRDLPNIAFIAKGLITGYYGGNSTSWADATETWQTKDGKWNKSIYDFSAEKLLMSSGQKLFQLGGNTTQDGAPITASLTKTNLHLNESESFKYLKRVWPRLNGGQGEEMRLTVGGHDTASGLVNWSNVNIWPRSTRPYLPVNATGKELALKLESVGGSEYEVVGLTLEINNAGRF